MSGTPLIDPDVREIRIWLPGIGYAQIKLSELKEKPVPCPICNVVDEKAVVSSSGLISVVACRTHGRIIVHADGEWGYA